MLRWHLRHSYHSGEIKLSTHIPRTCGRREKWPSIYGLHMRKLFNWVSYNLVYEL